MACRVRSSSMTLKDFHDKTPGHASAGLPNKPAHMGGFVHDAMDVESVESRFSDMSLSPFGGYGTYVYSDSAHSESPHKGNGHSMLHSPHGMAGERGADIKDSWHAQRGYERPRGIYSRPSRNDASHDGDFGHIPLSPPRYSNGWSNIRGTSKHSGSRTPDSEGSDSSFHGDVHQLAGHDDFSFQNHYVSKTSARISAEETTKANGCMESGPNGSRPMLELQPRSAPLPAGSDDDAQPKQAAQGAGQRPKLQLQPRSKPLDNGSSRQSTLFGAARPREEILKERGVNPVAVDAAPPPQSALLPSISARSALAMPVTQSVPDQAGSDWQTVGAKRGHYSYDHGPDYLGSGRNPLLSRAVPTMCHYQTRYQPYENSGYSSGYGHSQGWYSFGHERDEADKGDPGFPGSRSLPTREDLF